MARKKKKKQRKIAGCLIPLVLVFLVLVFGAMLGINTYIVTSTDRQIADISSAGGGYDCIVVLGCAVRSDGTPSSVLADRLDTAIALYEAGCSTKILMSGDHGRKGYDEVNTMKSYAINKGVPSESIFMDHAGFSTYETFYRARDIFGAKRVLVVTQEFHLNRSLYLANALGLSATGVKADRHIYSTARQLAIREFFARVKDFIYAEFIKPEPTYLGEAIPISGSGDATND